MTEVIEFVGGPKDGTVLAVRELSPSIYAASVDPVVFKVTADEVPEPLPVRKHEYVRGVISDTTHRWLYYYRGEVK